MPAPLLLLPLAVLAYLVGSIPCGYLVARARGVNILQAGSGNVGATNVGRVLGRGWGLFVFVLDLAKGAFPTFVGLSAAAAMELPPETAGVAGGVAAFLGHLYPIFLGFRGGKGVATGAGVVLVLVPGPAVLALTVWVVVVVSSRYVSLASLTAAVALLIAYQFDENHAWDWPRNVVTAFCFVAVALVVARHWTNIDRLLHGRENRLHDSPRSFLLGKILHVLALGLWFGMAIFFTFVVGLSLFGTFERLSVEPRPTWLPVPPEFAGEPPSPRFPNPLRKEQGSRIAGAAVGPLFHWYFALQTGCGITAAATALSWSMTRFAERVQRLRAGVLVLALATVVGGWWLEHRVGELRERRNEATDLVLATNQPSPAALAHAEETRAAFGRWHLASLLLNFATVVLVTAGMALTAQLPAWQPDKAPPEKNPGSV